MLSPNPFPMTRLTLSTGLCTKQSHVNDLKTLFRSAVVGKSHGIRKISAFTTGKIGTSYRGAGVIGLVDIKARYTYSLRDLVNVEG